MNEGDVVHDKEGETHRTDLLAIQADHDSKIEKMKGMQEENDPLQPIHAGLSERLSNLPTTTDGTSVADEAKAMEKLREENDLLRAEAASIMERLRQLQAENEMLKVMLEEEEEEGENDKSLDDLEDRLTILEQTKDAEIATLVEERNELRRQVLTLREWNGKLQNKLDATSDVEKLRQKRDKKKKTLSERLAAYESMSTTGSVVSTDHHHARHTRLDDKDDTMSTVSGMTHSSLPVASREMRLSDDDSTTPTRRRPSPLPSSSHPLHSHDWLLSNYPSSKRNRKRDLEGIFPSSVSVTGLSLSEPSDRTLDKAGVPFSVMVRQERRSSSSGGIQRLRNIMEHRDDGSIRSGFSNGGYWRM